MLTVGPGDISEYGTGISTPAQSSAISIRVEASSVAVRRGMERQYGTGMTTGPRGRPYEGEHPPVRPWSPGAAPALTDRREGQTGSEAGSGTGTGCSFSMASRNRA
ncbi:hypothetical protein San01_29670 [Streptomyces angustmyceticus]|uniref:Uncharacterized protein n=1 Tax=Streptomyces angustmyceticus TaxID=285578 RepID=A0A5J4LG47_9ACTN|nr:hypothetical protein San01_29670 [Streptomyces angustmyceticus]